MKISVIGATGYTGFELVKLLLNHKYAEIAHLTTESYAGKRMSDVYPFLRRRCDMLLSENNFDMVAADSEAVFLCLPHGASQEAAEFFYKRGVLTIDLSADFRIGDRATYESVYATTHTCPDLLSVAVYGIPELFGEKVKGAKLIANPGCYPTSIIMPMYPLIKAGLVEPSRIIADSKSGVSGAGRKATEKTHYCEVNEDFKAYGVFSHRHNPEIDFILGGASAEASVIFTPHLLPVTRGILSTIYARTTSSRPQLLDVLNKTYADAPFVRIIDTEEPASIKNVANTNYIDISLFVKGNDLIVTSAIDNLIRGASGQAVQNLNVAMGWDVTEGLL